MNKILLKTTVTTLSNDGSGVGRTAGGKVIFVPFTSVGDEIELSVCKETKSMIYGKLENILTSSADRIPNDCENFTKCGGCDFRHISYEAELRAKEMFIRDAFMRISRGSALINLSAQNSFSPEFLPLIPSEHTEYYRNKVQFPVGRDNSGRMIYGFYAPKSHEIIPHRHCKLYPAVFKEIADEIIKTVPAGLQNIIIRKGHYSDDICVNFPPSEEQDITDTMCGINVKISPRSFYQVNTPAAEKLYGMIRDFAEPDGKVILDLYCGIGTIGLSMAKTAKHVTGVEAIESAVTNARENAFLNGFNNTDFICGNAKVCKEFDKNPDVIILDPARRGCDVSVLESAAELSPERIIMVSCNPATAARDCGILSAFGYRTVKVGGVDLFPRTRHAECAVLLVRQTD
ncbi:MAG: class I SAM-dependent RNA methyltransferase [Oscillospiraceae bacterium]|nr:class I SAM-dependent RNA methyltransferase [Oscillospiraceae bacterium]